MKEIKNILLCGLGAIGTIYASKFLDVDSLDFRVLLDEKRFENYKNNPVKFNGKVLNPIYILPERDDYKADLIIIATKSLNLKEVINNIKNFVYDETIIISLLNGITSEKIIAEKYGNDKVLYSYFIGHSAHRNGRDVYQDGVNTLVFGSPENNKNVQILKNLLDKCNISYSVPDDIIYSMWLKFMLNVSSNQTSAVLGYTFGQMLNNKNCVNFLISIMKEVQEIAKVHGVNNTNRMIDDAFGCLKSMSFDGKTSMLQDIEAKRPPEIDIFADVVIEMGKKYNIETPYNKILKQLIQIRYSQSISEH